MQGNFLTGIFAPLLKRLKVCILDVGTEFGAIFSLQLSSQTQLCKIKNKKAIAENQCEKHKN